MWWTSKPDKPDKFEEFLLEYDDILHKYHKKFETFIGSNEWKRSKWITSNDIPFDVFFKQNKRYIIAFIGVADYTSREIMRYICNMGQSSEKRNDLIDINMRCRLEDNSRALTKIFYFLKKIS